MKRTPTPAGIRSRIVEFLPAVRAGDLVPDARNWRRHPKAQQDALRGLLTEIGYADALLARRTPDGLKLVDGHLRASLDPAQSVPVLVLDLDEHEAGKLLLTLDPLAAMAQADGDALVKLLDEERFTDAGVNAMLEALANGEKLPMPGLHGLTDDDAVPDDAPTTCKPGDLWLLGDHRLLCGDSTVITDVEKLMQGEKADMVWTDPPYGVNYGDKIEAANPMHYRVRQIKNDDLPAVELETLIRTAMSNISLNANDGAAVYVASPAGTPLPSLIAAFKGSGFDFHWGLIWVKDQLVLSRGDYHFRHENILYGWKPGAAHYFTADRTQDSVFECPRPKSSAEHPTMKPVALIERMVNNSSQRGQIVADPFGGSGSTLIACEKLGRKCRMLEIDPHYCDVIIRRWEDFTGKKAVRG